MGDLRGLIEAGDEGGDDLVTRLRVRGKQHGEMPNHYVRRMEVERIEAADRIESEAAEAKVAALVEALTLAANRLLSCSVDCDTGTLKFIETGEWAEEARAAIAAAKEGA